MPSVASATDQPGALEDEEMLRDGIDRHAVRDREFGDPSRTAGKRPQQCAARAVGERVKDVVEVVLFCDRIIFSSTEWLTGPNQPSLQKSVNRSVDSSIDRTPERVKQEAL